MRKLALTSLFVIFAIKSVSACSYVAGYNPNDHLTFAQRNTKFLLLGSIVIFIIITLGFFIRKYKDTTIFILALCSIPLSIALTFIYAMIDMCDNSFTNVLLYEFIFIVSLLLIQLTLCLKDIRKSINS